MIVDDRSVPAQTLSPTQVGLARFTGSTFISDGRSVSAQTFSRPQGGIDRFTGSTSIPLDTSRPKGPTLGGMALSRLRSSWFAPGPGGGGGQDMESACKALPLATQASVDRTPPFGVAAGLLAAVFALLGGATMRSVIARANFRLAKGLLDASLVVQHTVPGTPCPRLAQEVLQLHGGSLQAELCAEQVLRHVAGMYHFQSVAYCFLRQSEPWRRFSRVDLVALRTEGPNVQTWLRNERIVEREFQDYLNDCHTKQLAIACNVEAGRLYANFKEREQTVCREHGLSEEDLKQSDTMKNAYKRLESHRKLFTRARRRFKVLFENELLLQSEDGMHSFEDLMVAAPPKVQAYMKEFPQIPLEAFAVEFDNFKTHMYKAFNNGHLEVLRLDSALLYWESWLCTLLDDPECFYKKLGFSAPQLEKTFAQEEEQFLRCCGGRHGMTKGTWRQTQVYVLIRHALDILAASARWRNQLRLSDELVLSPNWSPDAWKEEFERLKQKHPQIATSKGKLDQLLDV